MSCDTVEVEVEGGMYIHGDLGPRLNGGQAVEESYSAVSMLATKSHKAAEVPILVGDMGLVFLVAVDRKLGLEKTRVDNMDSSSYYCMAALAALRIAMIVLPQASGVVQSQSSRVRSQVRKRLS